MANNGYELGTAKTIPDGASIRPLSYGSLDPAGTNNAGFSDVMGMEYMHTESKQVIVSDFSHGAIFKLDVHSGAVTELVSGFTPGGLDINPTNDNFLVADRQNGIVKEFDKNGSFQRSVAVSGVMDVSYKANDFNTAWAAAQSSVEEISLVSGGTIDSNASFTDARRVAAGNPKVGGCFVSDNDTNKVYGLTSNLAIQNAIWFPAAAVSTFRMGPNASFSHGAISSEWGQGGSRPFPMTMVFGDFNTGLSNHGYGESHPLATIPFASNHVTIDPEEPAKLLLTYHTNLFQVDLRTYDGYRNAQRYRFGLHFAESVVNGATLVHPPIPLNLWDSAHFDIEANAAVDVHLRQPIVTRNFPFARTNQEGGINNTELSQAYKESADPNTAAVDFFKTIKSFTANADGSIARASCPQTGMVVPVVVNNTGATADVYHFNCTLKP